MVWAKIDDAILDNAKIAKVGVFGFAMHVAAITWCCRNLTDGHVPTSRVTALLTLQNVNIDCANPLALVGGPTSMGGQTGLDPFVVADALVNAGLWNVAEGGYQIHDFLEYNPSKEQVLSAREKTKKRVGKHRSNVVSNGNVTVLQTKSNGVSNGPVTPHPVPDPVINLKPSSVPLEVRSPKGSPKIGKRIAEDYYPTETTLQQCRLLGHSSPQDLVPAFIDYWIAKTGQSASKLNWDATFRNWVRTDLKSGYGGKRQLQRNGFTPAVEQTILAAMGGNNEF